MRKKENFLDEMTHENELIIITILRGGQFNTTVDFRRICVIMELIAPSLHTTIDRFIYGVTRDGSLTFYLIATTH